MATKVQGAPQSPIQKLTDAQWAQALEWHRQGYHNAMIARCIRDQFGVSVSRERLGQTLGPRRAKIDRPSPGSRQVDVRISPAEDAIIREIAADLGYRIWRGRNLGSGNISSLLRAIAHGEVEVRKSGKVVI